MTGGPTEGGAPDAASGNVGPGNVGPEDAGPGNVGPEDAGPGNVGPGNVGPGNVGPEHVVEELRALGLLALDRLDPLVGRLTEAVSAAPEPDGTAAHRCTACPVCVALTERADALAEVAQHATGLLAALRVVLAEGGRAEGARPGPAAPRPDRVVQHIPVERTPTC